MSGNWIEVCSADNILDESVIEFEHDGKSYAVYRSPDNTFHATDLFCTHEKVPLSEGLVMGDIVECSKHCGRFNYKTGEALNAPLIHDIRTFPAKIDRGIVFIDIG